MLRHAAVLSVLALLLAPALSPATTALPVLPEAGETPRLIVGFHEVPPASPGETWRGARVLEANTVLRFLVLEARPDGLVAAAARTDPAVAYVEEDRTIRLHLAPNDPQWSSQYGPQQVNAPAAWDTTTGSLTKNVCIVDTGVRRTHEDLAARWLGGYDYVNNDADPSDDHGHGTHVAGTAAAGVHNGKGIAGIANVGIKATKVLGRDGSGQTSWVASGIQWCADNEGHVVSLSLGSSWSSTTLLNAVNYAWAKGSLLVAAAGNDGPCGDCVGYPAAYANAMAVTCTTSSRSLCSFSSKGPEAELAAPGYSILSTMHRSNTDYDSKSGTSMSTPHVSGVAALVWSYAPGLSNYDLRQILRDTAQDIGAPGWDQDFGYGIVDAAAALAAAAPPVVQRTLYRETFDDGVADGWTLTGLWHVDDRCATPPTPPKYLGYHRTGACDYDAGLSRTTGSATLTLDLREVIVASLSFDHRSITEQSSSAGSDMREVRVSVDNGASWIPLRKWDSRDPNVPAFGAHSIALTGYAGKVAKIQFLFDSGNGLLNHYDGWYLDNVVLTGATNWPPNANAGPDVVTIDPDGDGSSVVTLDAAGSSDRDGSIVAYEWTVGGAVVSTASRATLAFPVGTTTATVRVTDDDGDSSKDDVRVTVNPNRLPVANAGPDRVVKDADGTGAESIFLDGSASSDPDGPLASWEWRLGSTVLATTPTATLSLPVGVHPVTLTVRDSANAAASDTAVVTVLANAPPTATFTRSCLDFVCTFDARGSSDPDGGITSFAWDFGDGATGAGNYVSHTYPAFGNYTATLVVTDTGGATGSKAVAFALSADRGPVASFTYACSLVICDFDGRGTVDAEGVVVAWEWRFGDGATGYGSTVRHVYAGSGSYLVELVAIDDRGNAGTTSALVVIDSPTALLDEDFDDGAANGFGLGGLWRVSSACATAPSPPMYLGYHRATVCDYDAGYTYGHATVPVNLVPATAATLSFDTRWITEQSPSRDRRFVEVSTNGGYSWTTAATMPTPDQAAWTAWTVDLAPFVGKNVLLGFRFDSGGSIYNRYAGWYVDNVRVDATLRLHANAGADRTVRDVDGTGAETVALDAAGSIGPRPITSFEWLSGGEVIATGALASASFPVGATTVTLRVTDADGATATDDVVVTVLANRLPVAEAGSDQVLRDPDNDGKAAAALAGSAYDPDGPLASVRWLRNGAVVATTLAATVDVPVGTHVLTLEATDAGGATTSDTMVVTVLPNVPPVSDFRGSCRELTCSFDAQRATDSDGTVVSYEWSFGDGTTATGPAVAHTYTEENEYSVQLVVRDNGGALAAAMATANATRYRITGPQVKAPEDAEVFDQTNDVAGDSGFVTRFDIESAWIESDRYNVYGSIRIRDLPRNLASEDALASYALDFMPTWPPADPTWGGTVPPGATFQGLRLVAIVGSGARPAGVAVPQFTLEVRYGLTATTAETAYLATVAGVAHAEYDVVWWMFPRTLLNGAAEDDVLASPRAHAQAGLLGHSPPAASLAGDTAGPGRSHVLGTHHRAGKADRLFTFAKDREGFRVEFDQPSSSIDRDGTWGDVYVVSDRRDWAQEMFTRHLGRTWTPETGDLRVETEWRVHTQGNGQGAYPLFLSSANTDKLDRNTAHVFYESKDGSSRQAPVYRLRYLDSTGVARLDVPITATHGATYKFAIEWKLAERLLVLTMRDASGATLASGSLAIAEGSPLAFSFGKFGLASHAPGGTLSTATTASADNMRLVSENAPKVIGPGLASVEREEPDDPALPLGLPRLRPGVELP